MTNDTYITLLTAVVTGYFGYKAAGYANNNEYKTNLFKQQLYDVFLPMFKAIEDTIYQELSIEEAKHISSGLKNISRNHMELIDPYLVKRIAEFDDEVSKGIFNHSEYSNLCYFIDKEYERLKKILKLPKRGIFYKYMYKQMPKDSWKEFDAYLNTVKDFIVKILSLVFLAMFAFAVYLFIKSILGFFNVQLPLKL